MEKILLSWIAYADFENNTTVVSKRSPNFNFHQQSHEKYDKHLLLVAAKSDIENREWVRAMKLKSELQKEFSNITFMIIPVSIVNAFDLPSIYNSVEEILNDYSKDEIDIIFTIGSSMMSLVWYMLHSEKGINTRLIQGIEPKWLPPGQKQFSSISIERKDIGIISLKYSNQENDSDYKLTKSIDEIYEKARTIAQYDPVTTLIIGDSGSSKEHLAKTIHQYSKRNNHKFIAVNCSSLSDELLESRLFGSVKGAFTGSTRDTTGFFQEADKGTLFLDEIGDITPYMQQSLLRVLQEGTIIRVGDTKEIKIDVRVIAATNKKLLEEVDNDNFREDLYYRINETELYIPSLKERGYEEIKELVIHFIEKSEKTFQKKIKFSGKSLDLLSSYSYPGNVRQMKAIIKNLFIFNDKKVDENVINKLLKTNKSKESINLEDVKRNHINKIYKHFNYKKQKTADALGVSLNTLKKYIY